MTSHKISYYPNGIPVQSTDKFIVARADGNNYTFTFDDLVNAIEVTDVNLQWDPTTGLLSKKGISSKGSANGIGTELFGLGASDAGTSSTTKNTVLGYNGTQAAVDNTFCTIVGADSVINCSGGSHTIVGANSKIGVSYVADTAIGNTVVGANCSTPNFSFYNTLVGGNIVQSSGTNCLILGYGNSNSVSASIVAGYQSNCSGTSEATGAIGFSVSQTHKGGFILGYNSASSQTYEGKFGWATGTEANNGYAFRLFGGTGSYIARDMGRWDLGWIVATDATRTVRAKHSVFDYNAEREYLRADATGTGVDVYLNANTYQYAVPFTSKGYTVATLPTGVKGDMAHVTDALAPVFLANAVGGGAVNSPVFFDGTNWVIG